MRKYYLDWLRVIVVLLLIPFHTSVSFSHIGNAYIYTGEISSKFLHIFISDYFNLWFMRLLFFIAGISVYNALKGRSPGEFIIERIKRLLLPVLFTLITIGPISAYILANTKYGYTESLLSFYPLFFIEVKKYLFWGHMWFCVYLFTFSLITLPIFNSLFKRRTILESINLFFFKGNRIYIPMLAIVFFEATLRPFYPGLQSLIGDWANFMVHISFYILGFILGSSNSIFEIIEKKIMKSLIISLILTTIYFYLKRFSNLDIGDYRLRVILSSLWGGAAYTWVLFYIGISKKYLNRKNTALDFLNRRSFSFYIFHYFVVTVASFFIFRINIPETFQWMLIIVTTFILLLALFEGLKRSRFFSYICSIR